MPPPERQTGDAGLGDDPGGHHESVLLGRGVHFTEPHAGLERRLTGPGIDRGAAHPGEIDHQGAVGYRRAVDPVAAAVNRDREVVLGGVTNGEDDVIDIGRLDDQCRLLGAETRVPDHLGLLVTDVPAVRGSDL